MIQGGSHSRPASLSGSECSDFVVLGIPYFLEENKLKGYFEKKFGPVDFHNIKRHSNGCSRGFGFVRMENYDDQVRVLSCINHKIGGRKIYCRLASDVRDYGAEKEKLMTNPRLFVTKLNKNISKERLSDYFLQYARLRERECTILDCFVSRDRSFAFVTLSSQNVARELIRQADFVIDGHFVAVKSGEPKSIGGFRDLVGWSFGGSQSALPFSRSEPPMRAEHQPQTNYDVNASYHRQPVILGRNGRVSKHGERSWYYRGDYRREYQASAARKQYVSDSAVLPTQRYDVDNNSPKESAWMTTGPVSHASSSPSPLASASGPPPGLKPEILSATIRWMQQSSGLSAGISQDNNDYEFIFI